VQSKENTATGERLRKKREERGLKAYWVADRMGIDNTLLSMLEHGRRNWTPDLIAAYEKVIAK
jgi:transcriptional regulator with XRE-family HTH domain